MDPVTLAVLKGRLEQIADEMDATLFRAAFNPTIAEAHDACHGLYDATTGATLVQGKSGLPIFVGVMAFATKAVIDKFPDARRRRHLHLQRPLSRRHASVRSAADPALLSRGQAVLLARQRRALARCRRRRAGQLQPGGHRVFPGRRADPAGAALCRAACSTRTSSTSCSPPRACRTSRSATCRRISPRSTSARRGSTALLDEYGAALVGEALAELRARASAQIRAEIAALPDGEWSQEDFLDNDGRTDAPLRIACDITKSPASA